jgi:hypothetical protein
MSNNKYYGRSSSVISRDNSAFDSGDRGPSWFSDYVENLEKAAVKSKKEDYNIFDSINNIIGNKSKYSNVEEAVIDMQKRTGLYDLLHKKEASAEPEIFKKIPQMKIFIDNFVEDRPGISVEAVVHDMIKINDIRANLPEKTDVSDDVKTYISNKIKEKQLKNPKKDLNNPELGKADLSVDDGVSSDNDPFKGCDPARNGK